MSRREERASDDRRLLDVEHAVSPSVVYIIATSLICKHLNFAGLEGLWHWQRDGENKKP